MIVSEHKKRRARAAANYRFPVAQPCEACKAPRAQRHHDDYERPLNIRWLCDPCHRAEHRPKGDRADLRAAIAIVFGDPQLEAAS